MQMWFSQYHTVNVKLDVRIQEQLFSGQSDYQKIDVFKSYEFGKMVALDGEIVFSDTDEFIYDEMVTHVPMAVHPNAKKILIIGGGDGGVAKELIKYPSVEHIDVVETDKMFVDVCRRFFPEVACGLEDERISMFYDDGLRFLRRKHDEYDRKMHRKVYKSFPISRVYQAHIPTCPSGYWLFGFASKKYHPLYDLDAKRWDELGLKTWYYTTHLHRGAFMLPKYVEDLLEEEETK